MNAPSAANYRFHDLAPNVTSFLDDVLEGFSHVQKRVSAKYFYDERGSELFEAICDLPEYYPTRTELGIMRQHAHSMATRIGPKALLIEYGSGSSTKTPILIDAMQPAGYVPIDISRDHLMQSALALAQAHPELPVRAVCADYTRQFVLPNFDDIDLQRKLVYFPGSTIGNFERRQAVELLRGMHALTGAHGCALVGIDLKKDLAQIEAAYNDAAGVTAEFTLNLLTRLNRELDADFELAQFEHRARYNAVIGRIETYLVSRIDQHVQVNGERVHFAAGEAMLVEYSCKYAPHEFAWMAAKAGLRVAQSWTDADGRFALQLLEGAQDSRCASRKAGCAGQLEVE